MAYGLDDRVREQATHSGTGAVTLPGAAVSGFQTFLSGWGASGTGEYCIVQGTQWETGFGTLNAGGTSLTRTTVYDGSSGAGATVNFSGGTADVFGDMPAELAHHLNTREIAVASAGTCDIGAVRGSKVEITGTTTITSFGTSKNRLRFVRFSGSLLLTYNVTSLILPGATSIQTAIGDTAIFCSDSSGNWRCWSYNYTGQRQVLTANRTYFVNPSTGNDSNTGLASGTAFATIQKAINVAASLDMQIYDVTIQLADGTYNQNATVTGPWLGSGSVTLLGNTGTPANVILNGTLAITRYGRLTTSGMEHRSSSNAIMVTSGGVLTVGSAVRFGTTTSIHVYIDSGGLVGFTAAYSIVGNAGYHFYLDVEAKIVCTNITVTLSGTPAFSGAFFLCTGLSFGNIFGNTYSGAATGVRYNVNQSSVINSAGGGATYLPGNSAGVASTSGQYI